jgi:hypothetical protein
MCKVVQGLEGVLGGYDDLWYMKIYAKVAIPQLFILLPSLKSINSATILQY